MGLGVLSPGSRMISARLMVCCVGYSRLPDISKSFRETNAVPNLHQILGYVSLNKGY